MHRPPRSDVTTLLQEARAIELLAEEADVPPHRMQDYWRTCADLITLTLDIEQLEAANPLARDEDPEMIGLRRRLRTIAADLAEMTVE